MRRIIQKNEKIATVQEYRASGLGMSVFCKKHEVREANLRRWVKKYSEVPVDEARAIVRKPYGTASEIKQLRIENSRLRTIVSDLMLDKQALIEYTGRS